MSASNSFETALLNLIFHGTAIANLADNAATSPATNLYVSLHTNDPGETGNQSTNETAYTGYARVAVTRDSSGWTVSGGTASNVAQTLFGKCTGSPETITYGAVGLSSSGTGALLISGALNTPIVLAAGATPLFEVGQLQFTAD